MTQLKSAISQIITEKTSDNKILHMSIVQKQSDLGLSFNRRLFILIDKLQFGYISKFKETSNPGAIDLDRMKQRIPIKSITGTQQQGEILKIFFSKLQNGKKVKKNWALKMAHQQLATKWKDILTFQKSQSVKRRSPSPSSSSQDKYFPSKSEIKKPEQLKTTKSQVKYSQYNNQLYQSQDKNKNNIARKLQYSNKQNFIIEEDPRQDKVSSLYDPKGGRVSQKILNEYLQQKKQQEKQKEIRKKQKQQRELQLQQLRKEKQQIERQKKQMDQYAKKLKESQKKIQEEKNKLSQVKNNYQRQQNQVSIVNEQNKRQVTVLNEQYFKIDDNRSSSPSKIEKNSKKKNVVQLNSNNRPKVENFNYFEIVNKLVASNELEKEREMQRQIGYYQSQADRKDTLDEAHDYIFNLQKQKISKTEENNPKPKKEFVDDHKLGWTFKYLAKEAEKRQYQVVTQFGQYCQSILEEFVNQFYLPDRKKVYLPKYKREEYYVYEKDDIQFKVAMIGLKQIYNQEEKKGHRDKICDTAHIKLLQNQFKNFQILSSAIKNQRIFRVPLTCLAQYRGFIGFFKVNSHFDQKGSTQNILSQSRFEADLQKISQETKISLDILMSKGNLLVLKLDQRVYRQIALAMNIPQANFDYLIIQQITYLMPPDVLHKKKYNYKKYYGDQLIQEQKEVFLRKQILDNHMDSSQKISSTVFAKLQKDLKTKSVKTLKESRVRLEQLSQNILIPIADIIKDINDLTIYFCYPKDLSDYLHDRGVNLRYLGLIYEHITLQFSKSCILSDIAARTCKILLRKTLQDLYIESSSMENFQISKYSFDRNVQEKIMDFFNCILGNTIQTVTIWKVLSVHSINYYNIRLQHEKVNKGYFLLAIAYHCGLQLDWDHIQIQSIFETNQYFNEENFLGTFVRTKLYAPIFIQKHSELLVKVQQQNPDYFNELIKTYDLSMSTIPEKLKNSKYSFSIRKYLTSFIPPQQNSNNSFKHLKLYDYLGLPTRQEIQIHFMELKWYLRKQKKQKYVKLCTKIIGIITNFFGDYHPLLSQLYDIFSLFYQNNGELEDSITFSKSSIVNMLKICGSTHPKTAQCYFQLGQCCIKAGKKEQAILNLQKSKKIFQSCDRIDTISYAQVTLKLGLLFLSEDKIKEAQNIVKYSLQIFSKNENLSKNKFQDEKVEAYQILFRCYQIQQYRSQIQKLGQQCEIQIKYSSQSSNFEKLLKLALYPHLRKHTQQSCSCYIDIISLLQISPSTETYILSFERLCTRITQNTFFDNFNSYLGNIQTIQDYILQNGTLKYWKKLGQLYQRETVNDFIALSQQLLYFLGEGYVLGLLRDQL